MTYFLFNLGVRQQFPSRAPAKGGGSSSSAAPDYEDSLDYLDPSNESDYELISRLREGLGNGFSCGGQQGGGVVEQEAEEFDTIQPYNSVAVADIEASSGGDGAATSRNNRHR